MAYNPATDFLGLWRNIAGAVSKVEMPGLDFVVQALARAGLITLSVSATAPVANQATTAWLQTAVPSYSAEGTLYLWNPTTSQYVAATQELLFLMLQASSGQNGVSWYSHVGGAPSNTIGNNGDFAIRTDNPGGIYGPKAAGAWPASPLPGTTALISSQELDNSFGTTEGQLIVRGAAAWEALAPGLINEFMVFGAALPQWATLSAMLDSVFGNAQGSLLYRDVAAWEALGPGTATYVLTAQGAGADPEWQAPFVPAPPFASGTVMLFQQSAAPTGWTKQTALNDYGLRVVSGAVGVTAGTAFSTIFAQTSVGNTTLTTAQMPAHDHTFTGNYGTIGSGGGAGFQPMLDGGTFTTSSVGGGDAHTHSINLELSYVDVILASKN